MWYEGAHPVPKKKSTNDYLEEVTGTLTEDEAQKWFARYCVANPSFMVYLLTNVTLDPVQDLMLRSFFLKDYSLVVAGRGFSKSFVISLFCVLYAIAHPGVKIGIASGTFRQSKSIMKQIESFASHPKKGVFLRACINKELTKSTDAWSMEIGGSSVTAIPLGKVRGYRFNVLIVDELLVVPKSIIDEVLKPFLMVRQDGPQHREVMEAQRLLVKHGVLKPEEVHQFYQNNKIIGLSSASYKFESLYRDNYVPYVETIMDPKAKDVNHCVYRMSYRAAPTGFIEESSVEEMRRSMSTAVFNRELEAIFSDESGGYYNAQKIEEASAKLGDHPIIKITGEIGRKYILAIDPNYNNSETSDDFAMAVLELDEENESAILVHAYAVPNSTNEKRCLYLKYLLEKFNIVYIIVDNSGGPAFIQMAKEFQLLPKELHIFEHNFINETLEEIQQGILETRQNFKPEIGHIVHSQPFNAGGWIRLANENLQNMIEKKQVSFAARVYHESDFNRLTKENIPIHLLHYSKLQQEVSKEASQQSLEEAKYEFAEHVGEMIELTKKECCLIELTTTSLGGQKFDLPSTMKDTSNPNRARKDSYSALLLGAWGVKCYFDITRHKQEEQVFNFSPRMFR